MKPSQLDRIKADLSAGKPVNSVEAFNAYQITRLASIINRLRCRGWPIITSQEKKNGIACYSLAKPFKTLATLNNNPKKSL